MGMHNGKIVDSAAFVRNTEKQYRRNQRARTGANRSEYSYKMRNDSDGYRKSCSDFYVERGLGKRCPHSKHWSVIAKR